MNIMKRKGALIIAALLTAAGGFTSCSDWDDHYDNSSVDGSNTTLWDEIASRPELSDFAEVLQNTTVFRQHKKTNVSYASLLQGGQALTVLAPVNGTFNKDSIIALTQTAQGDSAVEMFFVKNHLASKLYSVINAETPMRMLNNKRVMIKDNQIGDVSLKDANVHSKNGILHVMQSQMPYTYTVYETLTQLPEFSGAGDKLKGYNEDYFLPEASVSSGLVDGVPVYVDSVVVERNILMNAIGLLNEEDSTYYVTVPTNAGWQKAWDKASSYFRYSTDMEKGDSLQNYWTCRALLDDAVFSKTIQASPNDSVVSRWYNTVEPQYHVFYNPYAPDGLFGKAKGTRACSNGILYYYDEWPHDPQKTYFTKIEQEAEQTWMVTDYKSCTLNPRSLAADSISKGSYLDIIATGGNSNWNVTYKFYNTLSGTYDFCVVVLPKTIQGPNGNKRPCKFDATINYIAADGKAATHKCGTFITDPDKVDTIKVATFAFPACNFNQANDKISLTLTCNITPKENPKYNREMYLDCIFLRPNDNQDSPNE